MGDATHNQHKIISRRVGPKPDSELITAVLLQFMLAARNPLQPLANPMQIHLSGVHWDYSLTKARFAALSGIRDSPTLMRAEIESVLIRDTS